MPRFHQARVVLLVSLALTAILYMVPQLAVLAYPLMLISTVAHEMGHGIAALLVGGSFHQFEMWSNGSGKALVSTPLNRFAQAAVSAGGLIGPAVAAAIAFAVGRTVTGARRGLVGLAFVLLVSLIFVVRGWFGFAFVALLVALCGLVATKASDEVAQLVLVFLAVQLALSVFSRGDYLFMEYAQTTAGRMPSDVKQMSNALFLPFWFWGGVCGLISVAVLVYGLQAYWRR